MDRLSWLGIINLEAWGSALDVSSKWGMQWDYFHPMLLLRTAVTSLPSIDQRKGKYRVGTFDYFVSAGEYNSDETHISKLRVHEIGTNGNFKAAVELTRPKVIELIKNKKTFSTMTKGTDGKWKAGAKLEVIQVSTDYLKTKKDNSSRDNLESLPPI